MRTNILIDDDLMAQALQTSGLPTKRAAVEAGLRLLIQVHAQTGIRQLRGKSCGKATWMNSEVGALQTNRRLQRLGQVFIRIKPDVIVDTTVWIDYLGGLPTAHASG